MSASSQRSTPGEVIDLEGVRALVTGGTSGLGLAMARALACADHWVGYNGLTVEGFMHMRPASPPSVTRRTWRCHACIGSPRS